MTEHELPYATIVQENPADQSDIDYDFRFNPDDEAKHAVLETLYQKHDTEKNLEQFLADFAKNPLDTIQYSNLAIADVTKKSGISTYRAVDAAISLEIDADTTLSCTENDHERPDYFRHELSNLPRYYAHGLAGCVTEKSDDITIDDIFGVNKVFTVSYLQVAKKLLDADGRTSNKKHFIEALIKYVNNQHNADNKESQPLCRQAPHDRFSFYLSLQLMCQTAGLETQIINITAEHETFYRLLMKDKNAWYFIERPPQDHKDGSLASCIQRFDPDLDITDLNSSYAIPGSTPQPRAIPVNKEEKEKKGLGWQGYVSIIGLTAIIGSAFVGYITLDHPQNKKQQKEDNKGLKRDRKKRLINEKKQKQQQQQQKKEAKMKHKLLKQYSNLHEFVDDVPTDKKTKKTTKDSKKKKKNEKKTQQ